MAHAFIPSMNEWRALPLKEDRRKILEKLREQVGDKAIVETWGVSAMSYYTTLMSYGFQTKGVMETLGADHPRPGKKETSEPPKAKRKYTKKAIIPKPNEVSDRLWPRNEVIEVEHSVIPWSGNNIARPIQLPFPALRGSPSQLLKQFEALVLFLSALDEDTVRYEVHLSASPIEESPKT